MVILEMELCDNYTASLRVFSPISSGMNCMFACQTTRRHMKLGKNKVSL